MSQSNSANPVKNVVFARGASADVSGWNSVIPLLQAKGLRVAVGRNSPNEAVMMSSDARFSTTAHSPVGSSDGAS